MSNSNANQKPVRSEQPTYPKIPDYMGDPVVFEDKNLGIVLAADWGAGGRWIFRVHNGSWCSVRKVIAGDPLFVEAMNQPKAAPTPAGEPTYLHIDCEKNLAALRQQVSTLTAELDKRKRLAEKCCCDNAFEVQALLSFMDDMGCELQQTGPHEWLWSNVRAEAAESQLSALQSQLERVINALYRSEDLGHDCGVCRPNYDNRHEEGCPILEAERFLAALRDPG